MRFTRLTAQPEGTQISPVSFPSCNLKKRKNDGRL